MVKNTDTSTKLIDLKAIVNELKITVPILNARVAGNKVYLHLYGGQVVEYILAGEHSTSHAEPKVAAKSIKKPASKKMKK